MTLRLDAITRAYRRRTLFHPVTLALEAGETASLQGPNGRGKTTLLKMCAGLIRPSTGTVDATSSAFVSQDAPVYPDLTVAEHFQFAMAAHGQTGDERALKEAGLGKLLHQPAKVLSRGQRQRLHLAIGFASGAPLLLLDEPFTGLDAEGTAWLNHQLDQTSSTVLMAVHETEHLRGTCIQLEAA